MSLRNTLSHDQSQNRDTQAEEKLHKFVTGMLYIGHARSWGGGGSIYTHLQASKAEFQ